MKQEIKERVERIRKGEVPEEYRKTKVGIIPDDWKLEPLGNLFNFKNGINTEAEKYGKGIKFVNIMEIINNNALSSKLIPGEIELSKEAIKKNLVIKGDVLFNRTSETAEDIGLTSVYLDNAEVVFGGFVIRGREKKKVLHYEYKKYCFRFSYLRNQMRVRGQGVVRSNIGQKDLEKVMLPIPSTNEQQKIAEILSTWDKAIELKEKLIEEKKEFKRGLVQKLLTGKIRFPEFNNEWTGISLNNLVNRITSKNKENNKTVITISAKEGFVNQDEYFNKLVASEDLSGYFLINKGDFAYNKSYSNGYPVGAIKRLDSFEKAVVTTLYICFRIKDGKVSSNFLKYYFDSGLLNRQIKRIANEGGRAHGLLNVTPKDFFNIKVILPEYEEQEKISAILLVNKQGIQLLEQELFELKEQKKGLMQLLLTGIVRVEVD